MHGGGNRVLPPTGTTRGGVGGLTIPQVGLDSRDREAQLIAIVLYTGMGWETEACRTPASTYWDEPNGGNSLMHAKYQSHIAGLKLDFW